jgi:hypothetical protein
LPPKRIYAISSYPSAGIYALHAPFPSHWRCASDPDQGNYFQIATHIDAVSHISLGGDTHFLINSHLASAPALRQIVAKVLKAVPTQTITHLDASVAHLTGAPSRYCLC